MAQTHPLMGCPGLRKELARQSHRAASSWLTLYLSKYIRLPSPHKLPRSRAQPEVEGYVLARAVFDHESGIVWRLHIP
jgi:hypothetical protein